MANMKPNVNFEQKKDFIRHNEQIRIPKVLVIHDGKNLGVMNNRDALNLARSHNLDLVEVSPNSRPPVCHIIDYGKFVYNKQKKKKESNSKNTKVKEKEIDFRYVIADHDLENKVNLIRNFISKGFKVKCVCKFKQRENAHKSQGFEVMKKVIAMLDDIAVVEFGPKMDTSSIVCRFDGNKSIKNKENK